MRERVEHLFSDKRFSDYRRELESEIKNEISSLSSEELKVNSTDFLTLILSEKYAPSEIELSEPVKQDGGEIEKDVSHRQDLAIFDRSTPTYKSFQRLKVKLRFNVEKEILTCTPGRHDMNPPRYNELRDGEVIYYIDYDAKNRDPADVAEEIEKELTLWVEKVEKYVRNLNNNIEAFQKTLKNEARSAIEKRRNELDTKQSVMDQLGVETGETSSQGYVEPEKKRDIEIPTSDSGTKPISLQNKTFLQLLELIDDLGVNVERSARRIRELDEESLRDIFLTGINTHYKGLATGETFNKSGKTDILLRYDNTNLFIAECKFWSGKSNFQNAINQLLKNLTVRDSQAALIIFSKRTNYNQVSERISEATRDHEHFITRITDFQDHTVHRFQGASNEPVKIGIKSFNLS